MTVLPMTILTAFSTVRSNTICALRTLLQSSRLQGPKTVSNPLKTHEFVLNTDLTRQMADDFINRKSRLSAVVLKCKHKRSELPRSSSACELYRSTATLSVSLHRSHTTCVTDLLCGLRYSFASLTLQSTALVKALLLSIRKKRLTTLLRYRSPCRPLTLW